MIACSNTDNATQDSPPDKDKSLSKNEAEVCSQQLISEWKDKVRTDMEGSFKNKEITIGDNLTRDRYLTSGT